MTISSDDSDNDEIVLTLSGTAIAPQLAIEPQSLVFGDVEQGDHEELTLTIRNSGELNLDVYRIRVFGDYFSCDFGNRITLEPAESANFTVTFAPGNVGEFEGTLAVNCNDPNNQVALVNIYGTGVEPPAPVIVVEPQALDFDWINVGEIGSLTLTILNVGHSDLIVNDVAVEGDYFTTNFDGEFTVAPDQSDELTVTFAPEDVGDFEGVVTITSNDPEDETVSIRLSGTGVGRHFVGFIETGTNHSVLVTSLTFNDEPVPSGWEIGIFVPNGNIGGGDVWDAEEGEVGIAAWGSEDDTDQFESGDVMSFKVWDNNAEVEWNAIADIVQGSLEWEADGFTILGLSAAEDAERDLTIEFNRGWNIVSMNISVGDEFRHPEGHRYEGEVDVERLIEQLRIDEDNHHVLLLKNEHGRFLVPDVNFNNIPYWVLTEGYQVRVDDDVSTTWSGTPVDPQTDIPLEEGWNIMAYTPMYVLETRAPDFYGISPIVDHVVLMKNARGRFLAPRLGFSNLTSMSETQGYQIKVDEDVVLNYPEQEPEGMVGAEVSPKFTYHWETPFHSGENMSVLASSNDLTIGDQIAAVSIDGTIVGAGIVESDGQCGLAVWGDDRSTEKIDGLKSGEAFELRMWDSYDEFDLLITEVKAGTGLVYEKDGLVVLDVVAKAELPEAYYLSHAHPNPFNSSTILSYGLPEGGYVNISVYDVSGRLVSRLFAGQQNGGKHSVVWDAMSVSTGIYIVSMDVNGFRSNQKVMLIK